MEDEYKFETFSANTSSFDPEFTSFLNSQSNDSWKVQSCSYCHDNDGKKFYASCIFKK